MSTNPRTVFERAVKENFSFFADHGLRGPIFVRRSNYIRATYLGKQVGWEVLLDWPDQDIEVRALWLMDGKVPDGYYVSSDGRKRRVLLESFLRDAGSVTLAELVATRQRIEQEENSSRVLTAGATKRLVQALAAAVRTGGGDLVGGSPRYFIELNAQGGGPGSTL